MIIDFTYLFATISLIAQMKKLNKKTALVTGTTGYTFPRKRFIQLAKGQKILRSFNMSLGINLIEKLLKLHQKIFRIFRI